MTVFSLGWSRMKRDQLAGDDWSGSLKGIIATSLTNKCLSLGWEHRAAHDHSGDNFQSPAVPFNLRPNNIVNTGWSALSFFPLLSIILEGSKPKSY